MSQPQRQRVDPNSMAGALFLSSAIAGIILGIGARLVMRIVAITAHIPLTFTMNGTMGLVMIGFFVGFIAGFVYMICVLILYSSARVRRHFPGPVWRGLAFSVLLLVLTQLIIYFNSQSLVGDINLGIPLLNKALFAALALVYGLALGIGEKFFVRIFPPPAQPRTTDPSSTQS